MRKSIVEKDSEGDVFKVFMEEEEVNSDTVKQLYEKLEIVKMGQMMVGKYEIQGEEYGFTSLNVAEILDVPHVGSMMYEKGKWPSEYKKKAVLSKIAKK